MEDRSNKTIISSVLFLDIVEYSKKSVSGQISLKDRFNTYLSEAIHDVPVADRIILDTGDGAAVNFLGDVESALTAALRLRASLLNEDPYLEPQLLVRIGINLGPVRLVRDINGQPNIVGDGINVAQRVMGFADPSQILVSRSYYDAVSRLSAEYTGMFHYQGSRTDKHVREHEIYAIGYPGDQTTKRMKVDGGTVAGSPVRITARAKAAWTALFARLGILSERIKQVDTRQRVMFSGVVIVPLLLLFGALAFTPALHYDETPAPSTVETMQSAMPASAVAENAAQDSPATGKAVPDKTSRQAVAPAKQKTEQPAGNKASASAKTAESHTQTKTPGVTAKKTAPESASTDAEPAVMDSYISVSCKDDAQVFVDGAQKGKVSSGSLSLTVKPGKHKVILSHPGFGIYSEEVDIDPGKTGRIRPKVCN